MKKFKVGVIGNGFVGESQAFAFSPTTDLRIYDLDPLKSSHKRSDIDECMYLYVYLHQCVNLEPKTFHS